MSHVRMILGFCTKSGIYKDLRYRRWSLSVLFPLRLPLLTTHSFRVDWGLLKGNDKMEASKSIPISGCPVSEAASVGKVGRTQPFIQAKIFTK